MASVVFVMGPTASGKTELAVELCRRLPMEVISVDSAMVYRGLDIGTAKPSKAVLEEVPHRLIDVCEPYESYSAARFCEDARREIAAIQASGRIPLLVGGTGLYFRSLEQGLSDMPAADPGTRLRLEAEAREQGLASLFNRLTDIDPVTARRIHPNDPQRILRALEVYEQTGRPLSAFHQDDSGEALACRIIKAVVAPSDREVLHERIALRFEQMLGAGLVEEVERLYRRGDLNARMPALRMVGYRQVWQYLEGTLDYEQMKVHAVVATRQLAKRQLTWLRREQNATWFDALGGNIQAELYKHLISKDIKSAKR